MSSASAPLPRERGTALSEALALVPEAVEAALEDFGRLIAVDTSFPPGRGYAALAAVLQGQFAPLGFRFTRVDVPEPLWKVPGGPAEGERVNLIGTRRPDSGRRCGLYFHTDTVPAAPGWQRDPFRLTREGDLLYGLGAADMKGAIVAALVALRAAAAAGVPLAYDPELYFCTDEEGGLYPGVRLLAEQGRLPSHLINFNGGVAPRIWAGCFGSFSLLVRLTGKTSHGSSATGVNAIEAAVPMLAALAALKPRVEAFVSALPPRPGAAPLRPVLSISAARGGTCGGQVPARFEVIVSRRYAPEEDFAAARDEIETAIRAATSPGNGLGLEIDLIGHLIPVADAGGPHWPRWQKALSQGFGYRPEDFARWGANSASDFGYVQRAGVTREVILTGLGRAGANGHAPEEHTTVTDLTALARTVLAYLARDFAADLIPDETHDRPNRRPPDD
jgi:succinyl-diaminopimelate desuccinylase